MTVFRMPRSVAFTVDDDPDRDEPWQAAVVEAAAVAMAGRPLLSGGLRVQMVFRMTRPRSHYGRKSQKLSRRAPPWPAVRPDLTGLTRYVKGALRSVVWRDDAQIAVEIYTKVWCEGAGGVDVTVHELAP